MTPLQTFVVAALGGLAALLALVLAAALGSALYIALSRLHEACAAHRERRAARRQARDDLKTIRAIDARGITNHPKE
ncbi:hypothetical protein ACFOOM_12410 [Streptomyces echinoruber]|uniref:Uncharacterized protein n=1 Tax=Streptomyces echinoruber TaxID=68898 RepID=A0A918RK30_9ACTN|nr:hypothetical protein [Streptomyces echinoruber]GHA01088.1 hypothetical protein GCM10010389_45520 [Streptomyces echinoruber]